MEPSAPQEAATWSYMPLRRWVYGLYCRNCKVNKFTDSKGELKKLTMRLTECTILKSTLNLTTFYVSAQNGMPIQLY